MMPFRSESWQKCDQSEVRNKYPSGKTVTYSWDPIGQRDFMIDPDGGRFTYSFDAANQLEVLQNPQSDLTTFSYDAAGRRTLKELANGTRASFNHDAADQLIELANLKSDDTVISSFQYQLDSMGNRTSVEEASGDRVTWSYDKSYQLTREQRSGANAYDHKFTYDPVGNRLVKDVDGALTTSTYDAANQLETSQAADGVTTYTFDENGNQQTVEEPDGSLTTNTWDFENQMTLVELPAGTPVTMAYNAINRRVEKQSDTTSKFVWDFENDSYLLETDESGLTLATYTGEPVLYGNLVSQERSGTSSFYHFDGQGSTRELTDTTEAVTDEYIFTAFGETVASSGVTVNPFRYKGAIGYYLDSETSDSYVRRRIYSATLSMWLSADPDSNNFIGRGSPPFVYSNNRPILQADPSGLFSQDIADPQGIPKSILPRHPYNGPCMSHGVVTKWNIDDTDEAYGIIVQNVEISGTLYFCNGMPSDPKLELCSLPEGSNERVCDFKVDEMLGSTGFRFRYRYLEIWRVHNGKVYNADVFAEVPTNQDARDVFAHVGFMVPTRGGITKRGTAYLVPGSKITTDLRERLKKVFKTGKTGMGGVKDAYDLYSACVEDEGAGKLYNDLVQLAGGTAVGLKKATQKRWNCCACDTRESVFTYEIGGKDKVTVPVEAEDLNKNTDC